MKRKTLNLQDFTRNRLTKTEQKTIKGAGDIPTPEEEEEDKETTGPIRIKGNGTL